jgi:hypothetical protein
VTNPARCPGVHSLKLYWLARGNVLVGVFYDVGLRPPRRPLRGSVEADLAMLPNA